MDTVTTINLLPLFTFVRDVLSILGFFTLIFAGIFLIYSRKNIKQFVKKDEEGKRIDAEIMLALMKQYPDVEREFMIKPEREQNIENNQEIHKLNKKLAVLDSIINPQTSSTSRVVYLRSIDDDN